MHTTTRELRSVAPDGTEATLGLVTNAREARHNGVYRIVETGGPDRPFVMERERPAVTLGAAVTPLWTPPVRPARYRAAIAHGPAVPSDELGAARHAGRPAFDAAEAVGRADVGPVLGAEPPAVVAVGIRAAAEILYRGASLARRRRGLDDGFAVGCRVHGEQLWQRAPTGHDQHDDSRDLVSHPSTPFPMSAYRSVNHRPLAFRVSRGDAATMKTTLALLLLLAACVPAPLPQRQHLTAPCSLQVLRSDGRDAGGTGYRSFDWYADLGPVTDSQLVGLEWAGCDLECIDTFSPSSCVPDPTLGCVKGTSWFVATVRAGELRIQCGMESEEYNSGAVVRRTLIRFNRVLVSGL
jgi:hypothetical protein